MRLALAILLLFVGGCRVTLLEKHEHYHYPTSQPAVEP